MRQVTEIENKLICLKGFSSSTPIIKSFTGSTSCFGGGFYINYKGTGIVVDPGVDFVKNMHRNSISIHDIDIVIVTHSHMDHNSDVEKISSLKHDLNLYYKQCNEMLQILGRNTYDYHNIKWIMDKIDFDKLSLDSDEEKHELSDYISEENITSDETISLKSIETDHMKGSKESYAIRLKIGDVHIGYTSDTPYDDRLISFFSDIDILIFNISDIYENDVRGIKNKRGHLGYNGSYNLLKKIKPSLAIASEFCCTNGDVRNDIISQLVTDLDNNSFIIPGEIGTTISLSDLMVKCSVCHRLVDRNKILHISPDVSYGIIHHVCNQCSHSGTISIEKMRNLNV